MRVLTHWEEWMGGGRRGRWGELWTEYKVNLKNKLKFRKDTLNNQNAYDTTRTQ